VSIPRPDRATSSDPTPTDPAPTDPTASTAPTASTTSTTDAATSTAASTRHREVPTWLPLAAVGVTLVLWSSAFVAIRYLQHDFSAGALSLGRLLVGSLALGVVAMNRPRVRMSVRDWAAVTAIGVLWFGIYNVALNAGEQRIDAGTAVMLIQVSPLLIALLAAIFLGERFTASLGLGLALAFTGVAIIALGSSRSGSHDVLGVVLCLVSALAYSIALVLQKPVVGRVPALQVTWLACTVGAVACLPFVGDLVHDVGSAPTSSLLWVVYLGLFPTAVAFTTYAYALRHMGAGQLGVTTYLVPPLTIVMGLVFLGEAPPSLAYVGGILALVGVAVARRRPKGDRR
jgi:drug/metabolite transporter (DMT)-like permease